MRTRSVAHSAALVTGAAVLLAGLLAIGLTTQADIAVTSLFYRQPDGFYLAGAGIFHTAHWLATIGARILAGMLLVAAGIAYARRRPFLAITPRGWLFLLVGLALIPGLIVNLGLKDHWGRARPHEVTIFGGQVEMTPALKPQIVRHGNGSFVAGDPSFGFFLTAFAYVLPWRYGRRAFWAGIVCGILLGITRIAMGSHFFSDVIFGGVLVLLLLMLLHGLFFNFRLTFDRWRNWLFGQTLTQP